MTLPFTLIESLGWKMVPATSLLGFILIGIESIASELEYVSIALNACVQGLKFSHSPLVTIRTICLSTRSAKIYSRKWSTLSATSSTGASRETGSESRTKRQVRLARRGELVLSFAQFVDSVISLASRIITSFAVEIQQPREYEQHSDCNRKRKRKKKGKEQREAIRPIHCADYHLTPQLSYRPCSPPPQRQRAKAPP